MASVSLNQVVCLIHRFLCLHFSFKIEFLLHINLFVSMQHYAVYNNNLLVITGFIQEKIERSAKP